MIVLKRLAVSLVFVFPVLFIIFLPHSMKIDNVICKSQYGRCSEVVNEKLSKISGSKLSDANKIIKTALEKEIVVRSYRSQFKLPSTVEVGVIERKPKFAFASKDKKLYANLDRDGRVLSLTESTTLPYILTDVLPNQGSLVSERDLFALNIMYDMYLTFQIKEGNLENDSLIIRYLDGKSLIFPLEGDAKVLVGSAILILNKLGSETLDVPKLGANIGTIDLRFENPVLK